MCLSPSGNYDVIPIQTVTINIKHDTIHLMPMERGVEPKANSINIKEFISLINKMKPDIALNAKVRFMIRGSQQGTLWSPQSFIDTFYFTSGQTMATIAMTSKEADKYNSQGVFTSVSYGEN